MPRTLSIEGFAELIEELDRNLDYLKQSAKFCATNPPDERGEVAWEMARRQAESSSREVIAATEQLRDTVIAEAAVAA